METRYDYSDIMMIPRECKILSRDHADVSAKLGNLTFRIPLMTANMPCIINESIAIELAKRNYFYVMHRFNVDIYEFVKTMKSLNLFVSISIGVKDEFYSLLDRLKETDMVPDYVTIDISHGHSRTVQKMTKHIRLLFGNKTFIIAGNVATPEATKDLESWGVDAVKVGVGPGHVCSTSIRTGFGTRGWQLSAVAECAKVAKCVVIADGGISMTGDIAKAIHMGADWVMSGFLYAGHRETPTEIITKNGIEYKSYYGNASIIVKSNKSRVEGFETLVPCKTSLFEKLKEVEEDLQSAVSFSGGESLQDLRKVEHVFVRTPHIEYNF